MAQQINSSESPSEWTSWMNFLYVLFFLSGFSALIYEVAWMRMLVLSLGCTTQATSCILAVFLCGLAIGAYISGRLAWRLRAYTLCAYGLVEIGVGLLAPLVSQLILFSPKVFVCLLQFLPEGSMAVTAGRIALSACLVLPPTILMGASLPFLTGYLTEQKLSAPQFFSRLYGVNTLGGVLGTLAACYVGFSYFGLSGTILGAAAINIAVGLAAILLDRFRLLRQEPDVPALCQSEANKPIEAIRLLSWKNQALLCFLAGLSGFTAIGYEMLWTRMLRFSTTSTTYAFTAIVGMFLFGLALGSFLYNRWVKKSAALSIDEELVKLAHIQYFSAIACGASLACLPAAFLLRQFVPQMVGHFLPGNLIDPCFLFFTTFVYMFIPSTLIGISFPMITSICTALARDAAAAVGNIYTANTIGCVLGASVIGLLFIPQMGSFSSFKLVMVGSAITGAVAVFIGNPGIKRKIMLICLPVSVAVAFALCVRDPMPALLSGLNMLKYGEDIAGTVMVLRWADHRQLIMNGEGYSSTIMRGRRYMRMMGHLPALLNPSPDDALVICFGMGTTAGAVSLHPEIKNEDIVELSPLVLQSANLFEETNYKVLSSSKVHPHVDDGRNYLLRCQKKYDVITLEPPPPTEAGIVNLYSREFYELLAQHLKPQGIACQWVPMSCESALLWRGMVAAAVKVFAHVSLWESNNGEAILICSNSPLQVDFEKLSRRMALPAIHRSLSDVGLGDPYALLSTFVCSGPALARCVGAATALTDDFPQVEFFLPYTDRNACNFDLEPFSTDVSELLSNAKTESFDGSSLKKNRQAIRLLRQATWAQLQGEPERAAALWHQAVLLLPDNAYIKYAAGHKMQVLQ